MATSGLCRDRPPFKVAGKPDSREKIPGQGRETASSGQLLAMGGGTEIRILVEIT